MTQGAYPMIDAADEDRGARRTPLWTTTRSRPSPASCCETFPGDIILEVADTDATTCNTATAAELAELTGHPPDGRRANKGADAPDDGEADGD